MQRRNLMLAGALLAGAVALTTHPLSALAAAPEIGAPAPGFTGVDTAGNPVRLEDYRGKTVILEWTNHGCPYVAKQYGTGNMQALQHEATEAGHIWLSVISSAPGTQGHVQPAEADRLTVERDAAPTAVLLDPEGKIGRAYDARTTPHMYVIDDEGVLRYMGGIDDHTTARWDGLEGATNYVRAALDDLEAGQDVETPVARPYGCTVKYGPSA